MSYIRAEKILPDDIIELIQQYVDGQSIYIPKKNQKREIWGAATGIRQELAVRDNTIFQKYCDGIGTGELAEEFYLSVKSIQRIIRKMK